MNPQPQVPEKLYQCAGDCNMVYSHNMIGFVVVRQAYYCDFCQDDVYWGLTEEEREREYADDADVTPPPLPDPFYCCPNNICATDRSFPADELWLYPRDGCFWCSGCYPDEATESERDESPSLAQYLVQQEEKA